MGALLLDEQEVLAQLSVGFLPLRSGALPVVLDGSQSGAGLAPECGNRGRNFFLQIEAGNRKGFFFSGGGGRGCGGRARVLRETEPLAQLHVGRPQAVEVGHGARRVPAGFSVPQAPNPIVVGYDGVKHFFRVKVSGNGPELWRPTSSKEAGDETPEEKKKEEEQSASAQVEEQSAAAQQEPASAERGKKAEATAKDEEQEKSGEDEKEAEATKEAEERAATTAKGTEEGQKSRHSESPNAKKSV